MEEEETKQSLSMVSSIASSNDVNHQPILANDQEEMVVAYWSGNSYNKITK